MMGLDLFLEESRSSRRVMAQPLWRRVLEHQVGERVH